MKNLALSESDYLANWADENTRHLDLVASWETLLSVYDVLQFIDPINDEIRLSEFKWIIGEINKFLTRMKSGLDKTSGVDAAVEYLKRYADTKDTTSIKARRELAYNKLKQRWVMQSINALLNYSDQLTFEREEDDGE